jgi:5-formyltetrahydrofolate cyclo-ligase
MTPAPSTKQALRERILARRDLVSLALREKNALQQRDFALEGLNFKGVIAGYRPVRREADPTPLLRELAERGLMLALPCVMEDRRLIFRQWQFGDPLREGAWKIEEPLKQAPVVKPDMILLPLVAFDPQGQRLGYGGGYYDRLLADPAYERARRVGYGYEFQKVERLPSEAHDARLDYVVTEAALYRFLD